MKTPSWSFISRIPQRPGMLVVLALLALKWTAILGQNIGTFCDHSVTDGSIDCSGVGLASVPPSAFTGRELFQPIVGADASNPIKARQIAGGTQHRVWALTDGTYFFVVAESDGAAVVVDSPEGMMVTGYSEVGLPTGTWISDAVDALLSVGTQVTDLVLTHEHWDHVGAAGLMYDKYSPKRVWGSEGLQDIIVRRNDYPNPYFNNNRGVPGVTKPINCISNMTVGALTFKLIPAKGHGADITLFLNASENSEAGVTESILFDVDVIFPGWSPFYFAALSENFVGFLDKMNYLASLEFDILVAGHLTRLGTKADVEMQIRYFTDIVEGAAHGLSVVQTGPIFGATGIGNPSSPNFGNSFLMLNEWRFSVVEKCYEYVLDASARGINYLDELAAVDVTLRSHCWRALNAVRVSDGSPAEVPKECPAAPAIAAEVKVEARSSSGSVSLSAKSVAALLAVVAGWVLASAAFQ